MKRAHILQRKGKKEGLSPLKDHSPFSYTALCYRKSTILTIIQEIDLL